MNKSRLESYTDGVLAIVATIMVLELHIPNTDTLHALLHDESGYFMVYLISFVCVGAAMYNHHFLFKVTGSISKLTYWVNNAWLFSSSLLPFATAWAGRFPNSRTTELFYLTVNFLWAITYHCLSLAIINDNKAKPKVQAAIRSMPAYRTGRWFFQILWVAIEFVLVFVMPILGLLSFIAITCFSAFFAPVAQAHYQS